MNYKKESDPNLGIDCYWESHDMGNRKQYVYPSLPEPYINIYFPLSEGHISQIKGISSQPDYMTMKAKLFGVRLRLKGFFQLHVAPVGAISSKLIDFSLIGDEAERSLTHAIATTNSFEGRINAFKEYFMKKQQGYNLTDKELQICEAFDFLIQHYKLPQIIQEYSKIAKITERTLNRWFHEEICIAPKKLAQIARFHASLYHLHAFEEKSFYFDFGYFDQAHFIREFKKFTGFTPKKYLQYTSELYH